MESQNVNYLQQRRQEREQEIKRRKIIAIISAFVLLLLVVLCTILYKFEEHRVDEEKSKNGNGKHVTEIMKTIVTMCEATDYKETCKSSLESSANTFHPSSPTDILKMAISVVDNEVDKVTAEIQKLKYDTPRKKAGSEVCFQVFTDAKNEINKSMNSIVDANMTLKIPDLNNWLSAVMSYQETCVDSLTGDVKKVVAKTLRKAEELTSISLAIVSQIGSVLSNFHSTVFSSFSRRLLEEDIRRILLDSNELPKWTPNVTVAKDGTGDYTTIADALANLPDYKGRYVIYVKEGIYDKNIIVTRKMVNITMYGDGSEKTVVTGCRSYDDDIPTYQTATFVAIGKGFIAQSMGFRNSAGPEKHQAVALRVQSDHSIFIDCRIDGYQETLYAQTHRQFYKGCYILGTTDFIFGDASAVFQNCTIYLKKPLTLSTGSKEVNVITSQGRASNQETTGFVLQNCRILADETLEKEKRNYKSYLGRPSKEYSRTIVMESEISDVIEPEGWLPWNKNLSMKTVYYGEYKNKGDGADLRRRTKFSGFRGEIDRAVAEKFTVDNFIQADYWLKAINMSINWGLSN